MNALLRTATLTLLAGLVSGCAALGSQTPPDTYEISAPRVTASTPARKRLQLLVPEPTAIKTLDSNQIVVKPTDTTIEYLANAQWSDRLPRMVQLRLVQAFENTGRVGAVGVPGQGLAIDYQVVMELRRFQIDATGGNRAVVEIAVKALNDRNGTVRASRVFTETSPVAGTGNPAFVSALDRAFDAATQDIVSWMLRTV